MEINFQPLFETTVWSIAYWTIAIGMSMLWGCYGVIYELEKEENVNNPAIRNIVAFVSDFTWSLIGWCSLYLLLSQYSDKDVVNLNIFLGIIAVVGMTGYGSTIPEKIKIGQGQ